MVAAWAGLPPLAGDAGCDLCVIGLGASGLAAVEWGADAGLAVIGIDAGRVAGGAAGRNGGFLLGGLARFHHDVEVAVGADVARTVYRATLAELERLANRLGPLVRRVGSLRLAGLPGDPRDDAEAAQRAAELDDCRRQLDALHAAGVAAEWWHGPLGEGVLLVDDAACNPAERCVVTAAALAGRVRLHEGTPVVVVRGGPRPVVETAAGTISAGAVAVCVDGGLGRLVPSLAGRVRTARLQMLAAALHPGEQVLARPVYARWGYDYAQQPGAGVLCVGGRRDRFVEEEWTDDVEPTGAVQAELDTLAARFLGRPPTVTHRWAATAGFTDDGLPICELVDERVAAAGGYSGTGNLVGPLAARAAARLATGDLAPAPVVDLLTS